MPANQQAAFVAEKRHARLRHGQQLVEPFRRRVGHKPQWRNGCNRLVSDGCNRIAYLLGGGRAFLALGGSGTRRLGGLAPCSHIRFMPFHILLIGGHGGFFMGLCRSENYIINRALALARLAHGQQEER